MLLVVLPSSDKTVGFHLPGPDWNINNICEDKIEVIHLTSYSVKNGLEG